MDRNTVCSNTSTARGHQEDGKDVCEDGWALFHPPEASGGVWNSNFPMFCCLVSLCALLTALLSVSPSSV